MIARKRMEGVLGRPEEAENWITEIYKERKENGYSRHG